ncbi:MAG: hypothetical protein VB859_09540 [Planctomycetaceae bacterium]
MTDPTPNARLNAAVAALSGSLVQFTGDCEPWIAGDDETENVALALFRRRQQLQIARIIDLLEKRDWTIEFGRYPTEFTDLHFLSLQDLYPRLIANEQTIVDGLIAAADGCGDDESAAELLADALEEERRTLEELQTLSG